MNNEVEKHQEDNLIKLGKRLKDLRKSKGFTNYEQFAYTHNISRAQYGRYEKGGNISLKTLLKIIQIHNISVKDFFNEGFD